MKDVERCHVFFLHLGDMKQNESDVFDLEISFQRYSTCMDSFAYKQPWNAFHPRKRVGLVRAENCRVHVEGQRARVNKTCSGISTRLMPHGPKHRHVPICIHKQHTVTSIYHTFSIRLLHLSRMMAKSLRPWGGRQRDEPKGWGASGERSKGPSGYWGHGRTCVDIVHLFFLGV